MKKILWVLFFILVPLLTFTQIIDMDAALAEDFFRNGIAAFHNGFLNKAYISFEQALSKKPNTPIYRFWLGETYFRNGYNGNAIEVWESLIADGFEVAFLTNRVEQVRRMSASQLPISDVKWTLSHEVEGEVNGISYFAGPIAICPNLEGGVFVSSYLTGEILEITTNGIIKPFYRDIIIPYNRPFDLVTYNHQNYYLSEMGKDSIYSFSSKLTSSDSKFGEKGTEEGAFNGPQFMAVDNEGYLYVSDIGNGRISKFSQSGDFILSFGSKQGRFPGLRMPSGIACHGDLVVVADQRDKVIYYFDKSGNYLNELGRGQFEYPQGLTSISDNEILVADGTRLLLLDTELELITELSDFNQKAKQLIKANIDLNGNIIVSDFKQNSVYYLTDRSLLYSGLYMQIENVNSREYPMVELTFTVKDSLGHPFCGLDLTNFILEEEGQRISELEFLYSDVISENVSISLLMDYSEAVQSQTEELESAMKATFSSLRRGDYFALLSEDDRPVLQDEIAFNNAEDLAGVEGLLETLLDENIAHDENGRFDLGVHESVSRLLNFTGKRAIVYMTDGKLDSEDFKDYNLTKIENYLVNNNVAFYYVQMTTEMGSGHDELEYLAKKSGGKGFSIYSPMGLSEMMPTIRSRQDGRYKINYRSLSNDDYGRKYLSLLLEINHFNRTGRTSWGYYSPLNFSDND